MISDCLHAAGSQKIFCQSADQTLHRLTNEPRKGSGKKKLAYHEINLHQADFLHAVDFKVGRVLQKLWGRHSVTTWTMVSVRQWCSLTQGYSGT